METFLLLLLVKTNPAKCTINLVSRDEDEDLYELEGHPSSSYSSQDRADSAIFSFAAHRIQQAWRYKG